MKKIEVISKEEAINCARKLKRFCALNTREDDCYGCPFYDIKVRTKCRISSRDPFEWRIDNDNL